MRKIAHKLFWTVLLLVVVGGFVFHYQAQRSTGENEGDTSFTINIGDDVVVVAETLEEMGVIDHKEYLLYYFWKEKLRSKMLAGEYTVHAGATVPEIAHMITTLGKVKDDDIKITFPEGWTAAKMAQRLTKNGFDGDAFLVIAKEPTDELRAAYVFLPEGDGLEGYLFPDTYIFDPEETPEMVIGKMLDNYDKRVSDEIQTEIARQGKTLKDVMIMASIVEGEVRSEKDRKIVAGIFENRMDVGQALQSDATLEYVLGNNKIQHDLADLQTESPYNTYKYPGLPPTPVSNPSLQSIEAVVYPTPNDYVYFLSDPETGETYFAETLDQHNSNKVKVGL